MLKDRQGCILALSGEIRYSIECPPSSRRPVSVLRTLAFIFSNLPVLANKKKGGRWPPFSYWSEWGDSNSRHLEPKDERKLFSNLLYSVWRHLFRNTMLSGTVFSVVSRCSNPVYGQKCGQRPGLSKSQGVLDS